MQLLTLPKLAAQSGWPESRIRRMVARHQLAHIRVNGRLLLPQTAIEDYVAQNFVDPNAAELHRSEQKSPRFAPAIKPVAQTSNA
jgi:hypothetical protein